MVINKPYGYAVFQVLTTIIPWLILSNIILSAIIIPNQRVHIVTRLDKDTSGLMLFAKHGYAHARMDKQLQQKSIKKHYYALVEGDTKLEEQGEIIAPIARDVDSIITRRVHKSGKYAHTAIAWLVIMVGLNWLISIFIPDERTRFVCTLPT